MKRTPALHALDAAHGLEDDTSETLTKNWSQKNLETLRGWKTSLDRSKFIYQYILEKTRTKLNRLMLITLLLNSVSTVLSSVSSSSLIFGEASQESNVVMGLNIAMFFIAAISTGIAGVIKIYKYDTKILNYSHFLDEIENLHGTVSGQLILSNSMKEDANIFIPREHKALQKLLKTSPDIDPSYAVEADVGYAAFVANRNTSFATATEAVDDTRVDIA